MKEGLTSKWRIMLTNRAHKRARSLGVLDRVVEILEEWAARLSSEGDAFIKILAGEPVVGEVFYRDKNLKIHRWRTGKYRIFYLIDYEKKIVAVLKVEHRETAY